MAEVPALADLRAYYRRAEESLLAELKKEAEPRGVKLQGVGCSPSLDVVAVGTYGQPAHRVAELTRAAKASLLPYQELVVAVRIGFDGPGMGTALLSEEQTREVTLAVADNGADGIAYYNYSEAPRRSIEWIKPALRGIGFEGLVAES